MSMSVLCACTPGGCGPCRDGRSTPILIEQAEVDRDYALIRAQLTPAVLAAETARGRALTMEQAVAFAWERRTV